MAIDHNVPQPPVLQPPLAQAERRSRRRRLPLWPRQSVFLRLQWSHLATSLLPLLLLGGALLATSAQAERRLVEGIQQTVAGWIARDIGAEIARNESDLLQFGRQLPFGDGQAPALAALASSFVSKAEPTPVDFAILRADGQQVVRITRERTYFSNELANEADQPFFTRALQGLTYRGTAPDGTGHALLQIAVPARNAVGQVKGVVVARLDPHSIEAVLQNVPAGTGRSAFVIDEQGKVLLGLPAPTTAGAAEETSEAPPAVTWPRLAADGTAVMTIYSEKRLVAQAAISAGGWAVVIEQPTSVALRNVGHSIIFVALVLALTGIGVVTWSLLVARRMTQPILELRDTAQLLAGGHLGRTLEVEREDELGQLAREFNRMSLRLAESQQALEERNLRLRQGLTLARHIQQDLLPAGGPPSEAVRSCAVSEPAAEIGGDFYTYLLLPNSRVAFVIGDASGKGIAAALVMALTSTLVEVHAPRAHGPGALLATLNTQLYARLNASHSSVALLVAEFDPQTGQVCAANAGMIAPLLVARHGCSYLPCYGPPLGIVPTVHYDEHTVELQPDQTVLLISDGIVEARNAAGELWGFERMEQALAAVAGDEPEDIVEHLRRELMAFMRDAEVADDMTIIAAQFTGVAARIV